MATDSPAWRPEDREAVREVFRLEYERAARELCPPPGYVAPPKDAPLGEEVFRRLKGYMSMVLLSESWAADGYTAHSPLQDRARRAAHEDALFADLVEQFGGSAPPPQDSGDAPVLSGLDSVRAWIEHQRKRARLPAGWDMFTLRALFDLARAAPRPPPLQRGVRPEPGLHLTAGRNAVAFALRRNFDIPTGQADVVTAFVEVSERECARIEEEAGYEAVPASPGVRRCRDHEYLGVLFSLLAGAERVRMLPRSWPVGKLVAAAVDEARHIQDQAERNAPDRSMRKSRATHMERVCRKERPGALRSLAKVVDQALLDRAKQKAQAEARAEDGVEPRAPESAITLTGKTIAEGRGGSTWTSCLTRTPCLPRIEPKGSHSNASAPPPDTSDRAAPAAPCRSSLVG